jgi:hypothetical protein
MSLQRDPLGIPKSPADNWTFRIIKYDFPEEYPIFWGSDQTQNGSTYYLSSGWHDYEYLSNPKMVRFLHDSESIDSDIADGGGDGGGVDPDPDEEPWELYETCVTIGAFAFGPSWNFEGQWLYDEIPVCTGIPSTSHDPVPCSPTGYTGQLAIPVMFISNINTCEKYSRSEWAYRGTVGGAVGAGFLTIVGYTTLWRWRRSTGFGLYDYTYTLSCPELPLVGNITLAPKTTPTYRQERPWEPDPTLPDCVPP